MAPTAEMVRSILGAVSQFEKAQLVSKLKAARQRKKATTGSCEGRKSYAELNPTLVRETKRLRRKNPKSGKRKSLQRVAKELYEGGYTTAKGNPFSASQVARLVAS